MPMKLVKSFTVSGQELEATLLGKHLFIAVNKYGDFVSKYIPGEKKQMALSSATDLHLIF